MNLLQFTRLTLSAVAISLCVFSLSAQSGDTCSVNDICETALPIFGVKSDSTYVCIQGCNLNASPDNIVSNCQMGDYPTVWYQVATDENATILNIEVHSDDFESPVISMFRGIPGCGNLEQVFLSNSNLTCIIGDDGVAKAIGTAIDNNELYYIAISSLISIGGNFEICLSTISSGSVCVLDRNIEITARSNGGPLEGPYDPDEKISICMNVGAYSPRENGCQWFQGMVPVFGNGWDLSSYDTIGQPFNSKVNGNAMGAPSNGLYGVSTWDWFKDVGYHHANGRFNIGDFDGNGRLDMCNSVYELNCPFKGVGAGCCGPCWADDGESLPPGWFAYGINGTCPDEGPPIAFDWGDGNSCTSNMGPWSFCFDLVTRDTPDCLEDSTKQDLSLGFFTFADGETGSWTGDQSVCAYDQPLRMSLKAQCGRITRMPLERSKDYCSDETFSFKIEEPGINHWEWNISPYWAVPVESVQGSNGTIVQSDLHNPYDHPQKVTAIFIGHYNGSEDILIKKISFFVFPCDLYSEIPLYVDNEADPVQDMEIRKENIVEQPVVSRSAASEDIIAYPVPTSGRIMLAWSFDLKEAISVSLLDMQGRLMLTQRVHGEELASHEMEIDIQHLPAGVYYAVLKTKESIRFARVVKI